MSNQRYAIDTCSLINLWKTYPKDINVFNPIWDNFEVLVDNENVISSTEIFDELKDDDIKIWAKKNHQVFVKPDKEIQGNVTSILIKHPNLINVSDTNKSSSSGDPFLVATAMSKNCIVVSDESTRSPKKIPAICESLNIRCINTLDFIREITT